MLVFAIKSYGSRLTALFTAPPGGDPVIKWLLAQLFKTLALSVCFLLVCLVGIKVLF